MIRSNLNIKPFFLIKIVLFYLILTLKSYSDNLGESKDLIVLGYFCMYLELCARLNLFDLDKKKLHFY